MKNNIERAENSALFFRAFWKFIGTFQYFSLHKIQRFENLFGSIIIITKKPILANRLLSLFAERLRIAIISNVEKQTVE